jgi:hypothetical protein
MKTVEGGFSSTIDGIVFGLALERRLLVPLALPMEALPVAAEGSRGALSLLNTELLSEPLSDAAEEETDPFLSSGLREVP